MDKLIFSVLWSILIGSFIPVESFSYKPSTVCKLGHPLVAKYPRIRKNCCSYIEGSFPGQWFNGEKQLTEYLETLKIWNCTQFKDECEYQGYAYTSFSQRVYQRFCDEASFRQECFEILSTNFPTKNNQNMTDLTDEVWMEQLEPLKGLSTEDSRFHDSCVQVAMYDDKSSRFHEIVSVDAPFCGFVWCGLNSDVADYDTVSDWTCLPARCRVSLTIINVFCSVASIAVVAANVVVIIVFLKSKKLSNSQSVYKISIAFADLLIGAVVFPTIVSTHYIFVYQDHLRLHLKGERFLTSYQNQTLKKHDIFPFGERASSAYYNFVGCVTTVSLLVSIYTLMAAGCDRLLAIAKPIFYFKNKNKRIACYVVGTIWAISALFACIPFFDNNDELTYSLVASSLISLSGGNAVIIYVIAFIIPLFLVWGTSIAMYAFMKRHSAKTLSGTGINNQEAEKKLAQTLGLMVGVFTMCLLPAIIILIAGILAPNVQYENVGALDETSASIYISFEFITAIILLSNSFWNCIIYSAKNKEFSKEAKNLFRLYKVRVASKLTSEKPDNLSKNDKNIKNSTAPTNVQTDVPKRTENEYSVGEI